MSRAKPHMPSKIKGKIKCDKRTKNLAKRLHPGDIALIDHQDIDSVSAQMLIDCGVAAVVNASRSVSGRYPNSGPSLLLGAGITVLDNVGASVFEQVKEGEEAEIDGSRLIVGGKVFEGEILTQETVSRLLEDAKRNLDKELEQFAKNTLSYVVKEKSILLDETNLPAIDTRISGRHVLIVVRGEHYREDLASLRAYIAEVKPVLVAVDGGADALLEIGLKPHIIIGDMDSVSDRALRCGAEIIAHTYTDNRDSPGIKRLENMGIKPKIAAVPGTSEDVAMLLAYGKGAELIVIVGSHSNLIDFLDKGRSGMSSTFLTRLKVGPRLVDARGVSRLYGSRPTLRYAAVLMLAVTCALALIIAFSPAVQDQLRMFMFEQKARFWDFWSRIRIGG